MTQRSTGWWLWETRGGTCPLNHVNIHTLYGVPAAPIEQLPTVCVCGHPITYAEEVAFVNGPALDTTDASANVGSMKKT